MENLSFQFGVLVGIIGGSIISLLIFLWIDSLFDLDDLDQEEGQLN